MSGPLCEKCHQVAGCNLRLLLQCSLAGLIVADNSLHLLLGEQMPNINTHAMNCTRFTGKRNPAAQLAQV